MTRNKRSFEICSVIYIFQKCHICLTGYAKFNANRSLMLCSTAWTAAVQKMMGWIIQLRNSITKIIVNKRKKYTVKICTVLGFSSLGHLAESRIQIWVQFERSLIIKILRKQNIFSFFSEVRGVQGARGLRRFRGSYQLKQWLLRQQQGRAQLLRGQP